MLPGRDHIAALMKRVEAPDARIAYVMKAALGCSNSRRTLDRAKMLASWVLGCSYADASRVIVSAKIGRAAQVEHLVGPLRVDAFGFVYFLEGIDSGLVKIGFSRNPQKRIADLERMAGQRLILRHLAPGTMLTEHHTHCHFADRRRFGEWFDFNDADEFPKFKRSNAAT